MRQFRQASSAAVRPTPDMVRRFLGSGPFAYHLHNSVPLGSEGESLHPITATGPSFTLYFGAF